MPRLLNDVLTTADLPLAELCATRLDGEMFAVGDAFAPIDQVDTTSVRAQALRAITQSRFIVERMSAAWVYGATDRFPRQHQFVLDIRRRGRAAYSQNQIVRECVLHADDLVQIRGLTLTSPVKTALDLLRTDPVIDDEKSRAISSLLTISGLSFLDCRRELERNSRLAGSRRALMALGFVQLRDARF